MKKLTLLIIVLMMHQFIFSQTNNTFPPTGNVGVGITNPSKKFDALKKKNEKLEKEIKELKSEKKKRKAKNNKSVG